MEKYEALVYHILYRGLPVENKIDNGFLKHVVDLFYDKLDSIPTKADVPSCSSAFKWNCICQLCSLLRKGQTCMPPAMSMRCSLG
jgi:hypothetical protein